MAGLSPRVRGNPIRAAERDLRIRSIPACTGEPRTPSSRSGPHAVYPRVYGGTQTEYKGIFDGTGLSPRVRGNPYVQCISYLLGGSIPACTGEPEVTSQSIHSSTVYPRVYGGTGAMPVSTVRTTGLSPRVRGNPIPLILSKESTGSIPACTGEPCVKSQTNAHPRVYPRVYGGTCAGSFVVSPRPGLSPRVRGNPGSGVPASRGLGSIPACTGEPATPARTPAPSPVYPRVYGGTRRDQPDAHDQRGLSPRVRGNQRRVRLLRHRVRSIPACTGEPSSCPR